MAEETYDEVIDKTNIDDVKIVEAKEENTPTTESLIEGQSLPLIEENEEFESTSVEKVAMKKKPACRAKLKDKVTCEGCGKELSRHSYDYTHKKYCKGKVDHVSK